jgi:large repetitive protein
MSLQKLTLSVALFGVFLVGCQCEGQVSPNDPPQQGGGAGGGTNGAGAGGGTAVGGGQGGGGTAVGGGQGGGGDSTAGGGQGGGSAAKYSVGGAVLGLTGSGLVLQNNGADDLAVSAAGVFVFSKTLESSAAYAVTVKSQPTGQTCQVTRGTGVVSTANVSDVEIQCKVNAFSVGGAVSGLLRAGLVLQNNGVDEKAISADGDFVFAIPVEVGRAFAVTIKSQPEGQTCSVAGGTGTVVSGNVTTVAVNCAANRALIGGTITGLKGQGLVLQNNAGDDLSLSANGSFAFATSVVYQGTYAVTVKTQPTGPSQTCAVTNGAGTVVSGDVTNIAVSCSTNRYAVGGTVIGLQGSGLILSSNANEDLPVSASGAFQFLTKVDSGAAYAVVIQAQPSNPTQNCMVTNGAGVVTDGDVVSVQVSCSTTTFTVGGVVSGLVSGGLVLQNNAGDDFSVSADGSFTFATRIASGSPYAATVKTQAPGHTCLVADGAGLVGSMNVTRISVQCTRNRYSIGGTVSGLSGAGLVLQNNAGDDLSVASNGAFTFVTPVVYASNYAVTVKTQPNGPSQTCSVSMGMSAVPADNVTSVKVDCATNKYAVGGVVIGLRGSGLVLQNNASDDLSVDAAGAFAFATKIDSGAPYAVTVKNQPSNPSQTCTASAATGNVGGGDVSSVQITCVTNTYTVGGTVSGLLGAGLVLQNNGGDDLAPAANGDFTFASPIGSGSPYAVTVKSQPAGQTCSLAGASGTVGSGNVTSVAVNCAANRYLVGGTVSGLSGMGLVLQNNGADDLALNANGSFSFATSVVYQGTYAVTVKTQPTGPVQTCLVSAGSGTVPAANVTDIQVNCTTNSYRVGGRVSGVAGSGVVLQNNGGDDLSVNGDGVFQFATAVESGSTYSVTVKTQPTNPWQTCSVSAGSGSIGGADVTDVLVSCVTNRYQVGGTVSGLTNAAVILQNNAGDDLSVASNGVFTFATTVVSGSAYSVTVKTNPAGSLCLVSSGSGTVSNANVTNVVVACSANPLASSYTGVDFTAPPQAVSTPIGVSWDGSSYYLVSGGGPGGNRLLQTNAAFSLLNAYAPNRDFRSLMWVQGKLYSRSFATNVIDVFLTPGVASTYVTLGGPAIDLQASVSYRADGDEFVSHSGATLRRWKLSDGTALPSVTLIGYGSDPGEDFVNASRGAYASGFFFTYADGVVSAWNPNTGVRLGRSTLIGADVGIDGSFSFSYANGSFWVASSATAFKRFVVGF